MAAHWHYLWPLSQPNARRLFTEHLFHLVSHFRVHKSLDESSRCAFENGSLTCSKGSATSTTIQTVQTVVVLLLFSHGPYRYVKFSFVLSLSHGSYIKVLFVSKTSAIFELSGAAVGSNAKPLSSCSILPSPSFYIFFSSYIDFLVLLGKTNTPNSRHAQRYSWPRSSFDRVQRRVACYC
jgi:hypothetical protein